MRHSSRGRMRVKARKPFGGKKFSKGDSEGKITIDVAGKPPTAIAKEAWREIHKHDIKLE